MAEWAPERVVDEQLARRLVTKQFPDIAADVLEPLGEGWDMTVWLVDRAWVFRFPRRAIVVAGAEREFALLGRLAPLLPAPIPQPVLEGRPDHGFPWPFYGAPGLQGEELADVTLTPAERLDLAGALGRFLRRLHDPATAELLADAALPVDGNRRTDMELRAPWAQQRLATLAGHGLWTAPPGVADWLEAAVTLPPPSLETVVHGDLHLRHVLIADGALSGVIDWIDLGLADRSVDLLLYWCALDPPAREAFVEAYGPLSDAELLRARVLALFLCATLADYGHREGNTGLRQASLAGLELVVAEG